MMPKNFCVCVWVQIFIWVFVVLCLCLYFGVSDLGLTPTNFVFRLLVQLEIFSIFGHLDEIFSLFQNFIWRKIFFNYEFQPYTSFYTVKYDR
jgi:hypothetical protein